jgi:hypothetical protein
VAKGNIRLARVQSLLKSSVGAGTPGLGVLLVLALVVFSGILGVSMSARMGNAQVAGSTITQQWLDQRMAAWKPEHNVSMTFQVLDNRVSYGNIGPSYNDMAVQTADLNMLISTKAQCVRMDIGYAPWLQGNQAQIDMITAMVQKVKEAGLCLIIADSASETYRHGGQLTWTQFKEAWGSRVTTFASLYHPDYYLVVKEPGWYVSMVSDAANNPSFASPTDWLNLTQTLAADVIGVSPGTKIGVSVAADSLGSNPSLYVPYLTSLGKVPSVSFLGYDIYTTTGFDATQSFLTQYGSFGKGVWIAEAWSGSGSPIFDPSRAALDKEWIQALYYFAENVGATAIMPFFTDLFASYSLTNTGPTDSSQIVSLYSQRTPVFDEYQAIVTSSGTSVGSSSSTTSTTSATSSTTTSSTTSTPTSTTTTSSSATTTLSASSSSSTPARGSSASTTSSRSLSPTSSFTTFSAETSAAQSGGGRLVLIAGAAALAIILAVAVYSLRRKRGPQS